jgi:hypothetical protein
MKANEFDNLVKEKFEQAEFEYAPANWEKLTNELHPVRTIPLTAKKWVSTVGIAASLLLVTSVLAWLFYSSPHDDQPVAATTPVSTPQRSVTPAPEQQTPSTAQGVLGVPPPPVASNTTPKVSIGSAPPRKQHAPIAAGKYVSDPQPTVVVKQDPPFPKYGITEEKVAPIENRIPKKPDQSFAFNDMPLPQSASKPAGKTFVSVTGGVNYGSLNTGYMAGINARQKLGGKLYVEGDLTVLSQQSSQSATVTATQYDLGVGIAGKPGVTNTVTQNESNFLYVQFNPSVGYQVAKKLSLSVGADLQRLLENGGSTKTLVFVSDEPRLVPDLDLGVTGKTEYSVTPRLKAGLLYREGINNLVKGGGNEYFDRRYLQVLLKFRVLGRN